MQGPIALVNSPEHANGNSGPSICYQMKVKGNALRGGGGGYSPSLTAVFAGGSRTLSPNLHGEGMLTAGALAPSKASAAWAYSPSAGAYLAAITHIPILLGVLWVPPLHAVAQI